VNLDNGRWRKAVLECSGASSTARLVACAIAENGWGTGLIYPSQSLLQNLTGLGRTAIRDALAELEALHWLTITPGSGRVSTAYTLACPVDIAVDAEPERVVRRRAEGRVARARGSADDPQRVARRPRLDERPEISPERDSAGARAAGAARSRCAEHPHEHVSAFGCRACLADQKAGAR
jgi:hypothetical protein